ncbi:MAG: amino acid ABC transporter permease [Thermanaeromonas sp.]|uniref:amino acid ABC transporter permease n=1 Tax=Thermanaeromonas sp. TaxID=2003697 RepID=UPI00243856E6|nr:amino acid ABC transporter permease [Thermanaeromonas sp.]MCG0278362.1 amino acid ABC transporter permease [Thermanaeromonas sp.]
MELIWNSLPYLLLGAVETLKITVFAVSLGTVLGLIVGLGRISDQKIIRLLAACYVDFLRGTPLLVQVFIVYFGFPQLLEQLGSPITHIPPFMAALIAFSLNSGAYVAEIFRAGIQSIHRGQMEAARSLGMTKAQAMRYVILPQAFRRVIPPLGNEFIALLKDTSLLSVIGIVELTRRGQIIIASTFRPFEIWFTVAFIYLLLTFSISRLVAFLERRLDIK